MSKNLKTGGLEEAKSYMRDKEIPQLFESMMTALMFKKPENHLDFLEECLVKAKNQEKVKWHSFIEPLPPIPKSDKTLKLESESEIEKLPKAESPKLNSYSPLPAIGSQDAPIKAPSPVEKPAEHLEETATQPSAEVNVESEATEPVETEAPVDVITTEEATDIDAEGTAAPLEAASEAEIDANVDVADGAVKATEIAGEASVDAEDSAPAVTKETDTTVENEVAVADVDSSDVKEDITETAPVPEATQAEETVTESNEKSESEPIKNEEVSGSESAVEAEPSEVVTDTEPSAEVVTETSEVVETETSEVVTETVVESESNEPTESSGSADTTTSVETSAEAVPSAVEAESSAVETETEESSSAHAESETKVEEPVASEAETVVDNVAESTPAETETAPEPTETEVEATSTNETEVDANVSETTTANEPVETEKSSVVFDKPIIFVLGGPGSGKGTQCTKIAEKYNFLHLSAGDLLRKEANEKGGELAEIMKQGQLVPQEVTIGLLKQAMIDNVESKGFLIDGFPREMTQGETFEKEVTSPKLVLSYTCPDDILIDRLLERGKHSGRVDDNEESIKKRLELFHGVSEPVIAHYGDIVRSIDSSVPLEDVFAATCVVLDELDCLKEGTGEVENTPTETTASSESTETAPESSESTGANIILVLGGPGSGKGTQCEKIVEKYGYCHLSTGDLLREEVKQESERANMLNEIMKKGELVPTDIILQLLKQAIETNKESKGFLIDGFPRDVEQGVQFEETVGKCKCLLYFKCSEDCMVQRLLDRAKTSGRLDDNIDMIKLRLKTFTDQTIPVVEKFKDSVKEVDAERAVDEIFADVCTCLDSL